MEYYKQFYVKKLDNLDEMNRFLQRQNYHNCPKKKQKICIALYYLKNWICNLKLSMQAQKALVTDSMKHFLKNQIYTNSFLKIGKYEHFSIRFTKLGLPSYQNQIKKGKVNYRPVFLMMQI